ncbi:sulfurtransferase [Cognatiluteimonas profundi]|uniref:sulfurtransferase n=1 Tax=Cognatiluteimonas profundi TaxID=2594501 RepID=UPI00131C053B|nr:sulfurtransferase [Lysobacter profundi]
MSGWTTLVPAETLAIAVGRPDVVVLDCRFSLMDPGAGERAYQQGHVPGALYAHLERDLSNHRQQGQGRHPWPDAAEFTARLGQWGITPDHQVVAYDDGEGAYAARLWFLLRMLGHAKVAVLDGGWSRWTSLGLPVDTRNPVPAPQRYVAQFDKSRLLDADQVQARLDAGDLLIDARALERFRGDVEPLDKIAGHVPGARNRPYATNLTDKRFKTPVQLAAEFRELLGDHAPESTIVMCGSGVTACHHLLAMERAGIKGAKLFTGSWSGWIADGSRPVAMGSS